MPLIVRVAPAAVRLSPVPARGEGVGSVQAYGVVPPLTVILWLYAKPTFADGNAPPAGVIVNCCPKTGAMMPSQMHGRACLILIAIVSRNRFLSQTQRGGPKVVPPAEMEAPGLDGVELLPPPLVTPTATAAPTPPITASSTAVFLPPAEDALGAALV